MTAVFVFGLGMLALSISCTVGLCFALRPGANPSAFPADRGFGIDPVRTDPDVMRAPTATLSRTPTIPEINRSIETIVAQQTNRRLP